MPACATPSPPDDEGGRLHDRHAYTRSADEGGRLHDRHAYARSADGVADEIPESEFIISPSKDPEAQRERDEFLALEAAVLALEVAVAAPAAKEEDVLSCVAAAAAAAAAAVPAAAAAKDLEAQRKRDEFLALEAAVLALEVAVAEPAAKEEDVLSCAAVAAAADEDEGVQITKLDDYLDLDEGYRYCLDLDEDADTIITTLDDVIYQAEAPNPSVLSSTQSATGSVCATLEEELTFNRETLPFADFV